MALSSSESSARTAKRLSPRVARLAEEVAAEIAATAERGAIVDVVCMALRPRGKSPDEVALVMLLDIDTSGNLLETLANVDFDEMVAALGVALVGVTALVFEEILTLTTFGSLPSDSTLQLIYSMNDYRNVSKTKNW